MEGGSVVDGSSWKVSLSTSRKGRYRGQGKENVVSKNFLVGSEREGKKEDSTPKEKS